MLKQLKRHALYGPESVVRDGVEVNTKTGPFRFTTQRLYRPHVQSCAWFRLYDAGRQAQVRYGVQFVLIVCPA